jgi:ribosomal protein S27AE
MYGSNCKVDGYNVKPQKWYCPNCSELIIAYNDSSGKAKKRCCRCGVAMVKYQKTRHVNVIEVVDPEHTRA